MSRAWCIILAAGCSVSSFAAQPIPEDLLTAPGVAYESYLVRWWGAPGSQRSRPIFRMARFDAGAYQLHYGICPGRELDDYTMPYWRIRSFLSVVLPPAELAMVPEATYSTSEGPASVRFTPRSGVELAAWRDGLVVKLSNRSLRTPEDRTLPPGTEEEETNPCLIELILVLRKGEPALPAICRVTNVGTEPLEGMEAGITFEQSFNWGSFAADGEGIQAPAEGAAGAFQAYSTGMERGVAFFAGPEAALHYALAEEMNRWTVRIRAASTGTLAPGTSITFSYALQVLTEEAALGNPPEMPPAEELFSLDFLRMQPGSFRTAPIRAEGRTMLEDVLASLDKPKVRGMNPRGDLAQLMNDIDTLKAWGCNFIVTQLGDPEEVAQVIERGHEVGMEVFLQGQGSYEEGPPHFDAYYDQPRPPAQIPDSHGQDEDHHYWYAIPPVVDFQGAFGKPMAEATHGEMVRYWGRCFAEKWRGVQEAVRPFAPDPGVWFYAPFPFVTEVDPLDANGPFLQALAEIGPGLTVFPFYYGIEHNHPEYMVRCWKEAGAARVIFLPMREFVTRPSQFMRGISAARRGGADGSCGFAFSLGEDPAKAWQWKAVMLAAWCNFPTEDLDALCLLEEPADLLGALARADRIVIDGDPEAANRLRRFLPAEEDEGEESARPSGAGALRIVLAGEQDARRPPVQAPRGKGFITMEGRTVTVGGEEPGAREAALELLCRCAELAQDERRCRGEE